MICGTTSLRINLTVTEGWDVQADLPIERETCDLAITI